MISHVFTWDRPLLSNISFLAASSPAKLASSPAKPASTASKDHKQVSVKDFFKPKADKNDSRDKERKDSDKKSPGEKQKSGRVDIGYGYKVMKPLPDVFNSIKVHYKSL